MPRRAVAQLMTSRWKPTTTTTIVNQASQPHRTPRHEYICVKKGKASPYSIAERRVPELIPVLGSQPAGDVSHKPGGRLPLLYARHAVTPAPLRGLLPIFMVGEQRHDGCERLPKTVTRQRRECDLNTGPSAPESNHANHSATETAIFV